MSLGNLRRQLDRFESEVFFDKVQRRRAILVSDSKGRYLRNEIGRGEEILDVISESGASSNDGRLLPSVREKIIGLDRPLIFLWLGTCDFTEKRGGRFIHLRDISVEDVIARIRDLKTRILEVNGSAEIVTLCIPIYSIEEYNSHRGHQHCEIFKDDDTVLQQKVESFNTEVLSLNEVHTPNFSRDLLKNTKRRRPRSVSSSYILKFKDLYIDGIHPCPLLSKVWLRKIQKIVCELCF